MNKTERKMRLFAALARYGIAQADTQQLRRIEMTLQRWSARECGDEHGRAIERDEVTGKPYETYDTGAAPGKRGRRLIPDAEKGALTRLAAIMGRYPNLIAYHQSDPRGCALYIVRRSDIPRLTRKEWRGLSPVDSSEEAFLAANARQVDSYYTRGIAVCA